MTRQGIDTSTVVRVSVLPASEIQRNVSGRIYVAALKVFIVQKGGRDRLGSISGL